MKLIHKKFNRSISCLKVKLFYLGTDVPRSYPGREVNFKKCLKRPLNFSVIFESDLGTSLMGSSTPCICVHLNSGQGLDDMFLWTGLDL